MAIDGENMARKSSRGIPIPGVFLFVFSILNEEKALELEL